MQLHFHVYVLGIELSYLLYQHLKNNITLNEIDKPVAVKEQRANVVLGVCWGFEV